MENEMRRSFVLAALLGIVSCSGSGSPTVAPELANKVVSGQLDGISENIAAWVWGDGVNGLCQGWSMPGWFYGTDSAYSSADVTVLIHPEIRQLRDAESLNYESDYVLARPGDTVVFRGRNGFFGAWTIDTVTDDRRLFGTWYFRSGGGGDFTADVVELDEAAPVAAVDCAGVS